MAVLCLKIILRPGGQVTHRKATEADEHDPPDPAQGKSVPAAAADAAASLTIDFARLPFYCDIT